MAVSRVERLMSMRAASDLSDQLYHIVKLTTAEDEVDVCNAASDLPFGILQNEPKAGEAASVAYADGDVSKCVSGAAIAVGDDVGTDASGGAVSKTTAGDRILGQALSPSSAAGVVIELLIAKQVL